MLKGFLFSPLLISLIYWMYSGCRLSLWASQVEIKEEIDIVEGMPELGTQTKVEWRKQFVPGIETPLTGFFLTTGTFLILSVKRSLKNKSASLE
jgi:hypothetical protein